MKTLKRSTPYSATNGNPFKRIRGAAFQVSMPGTCQENNPIALSNWPLKQKQPTFLRISLINTQYCRCKITFEIRLSSLSLATLFKLSTKRGHLLCKKSKSICRTQICIKKCSSKPMFQIVTLTVPKIHFNFRAWSDLNLKKDQHKL